MPVVVTSIRWCHARQDAAECNDPGVAALFFVFANDAARGVPFFRSVRQEKLRDDAVRSRTNTGRDFFTVACGNDDYIYMCVYIYIPTRLLHNDVYLSLLHRCLLVYPLADKPLCGQHTEALTHYTHSPLFTRDGARRRRLNRCASEHAHVSARVSRIFFTSIRRATARRQVGRSPN